MLSQTIGDKKLFKKFFGKTFGHIIVYSYTQHISIKIISLLASLTKVDIIWRVICACNVNIEERRSFSATSSWLLLVLSYSAKQSFGRLHTPCSLSRFGNCFPLPTPKPPPPPPETHGWLDNRFDSTSKTKVGIVDQKKNFNVIGCIYNPLARINLRLPYLFMSQRPVGFGMNLSKPN